MSTFKEQQIDIIKNELFVKCNDILKGFTNNKKEKGLGEMVSYPPIEDPDLVLITAYFERKMEGPPDPKNSSANRRHLLLQLIPTNNLQYIYQKVDKADKNHSGVDTGKANQGHIYEVKGIYYHKQYFCNHILGCKKY